MIIKQSVNYIPRTVRHVSLLESKIKKNKTILISNTDGIQASKEYLFVALLAGRVSLNSNAEGQPMQQLKKKGTTTNMVNLLSIGVT